MLDNNYLMKEVYTKNLTKDQTKGLLYLFNNIYLFSKGNISKVQLSFENNILTANGNVVVNNQYFCFESTCVYDGAKLMIKTIINDNESIKYDIIDTFYFETDYINVISIDPFLEKPFEKRISYISKHRN